MKLMKSHAIDELVTAFDLYLEIDQDIKDMPIELQAFFHQFNFIVIALDFKKPLREELAEWLDARLPKPEEWDWESTKGCRTYLDTVEGE